LWDAAFIARCGRSARRAWPFQATLDNFYAKQHPDGFICRQIGEADGADRFQRFDPAGTGPDVLAWVEWAHYRHTADRERLARVFPPLAAYAQWLRRYRTWPNGAYWATGWASGMDNQPRFAGAFADHEPHRWDGVHEWYDHGHGVWADANFQALLSDHTIAAMAEALGRQAEVADCRAEYDRLGQWVNRRLWERRTGFYHDLDRTGRRQAAVKSIGAYWALLAGVVPQDRLDAFLAHLADPAAFARPHRCPSLSADSPGFAPDGGYWRGGVWPPTVYMLLEGLHAVGCDDLAHEIACNHLDNVVAAFVKTGTLWENYAPDRLGEGRSTPDFVGWSGLPPIAVLFEHVFGLRPDAPAGRLTWHVRLLEEHGVANYPFGHGGALNLRCGGRGRPEEEPRIAVETNAPVCIEVRWAGGSKIIRTA
jgi:neutral trehalase